MAEIVANIIRLRACQAAVVALLAAAYVTVGDVKSLIVGREPVISTRYPHVQFTGYAVASVTSPPALIPSTWSTDSVEALLYETKTVLRDSPSVASPTPNLPTAGIPPPRASTSRPHIPRKTVPTVITVFFPLPTASTPLTYPDLTASGDRNNSDCTHLPISDQYWILDSVRGVFDGLKERIHVVTAGIFDFVELRLPSFMTAKDREIHRLEHEYKRLEHDAVGLANLTIRAADVAVAAQNNLSKAGIEIAQLRSIAEERERAFTKHQWACQEKLEEAAEDTARCLEEKDAELEIEMEKANEKLEEAAEDTARCLEEKDAQLEIEMEKANEALQKAKDQAKDDAIREVRHLTDLATQQQAEAAEQRKADEATIYALRDQSAADAKTIRELSNQLSSIARMNEKVASLAIESETLMKKVNDLRQEQARIVQSGADAEATLKATIGKLSAKLELADKRCQAAEAKASYQEALAIQAREEQRLAEERAERLEAQAAKAKAKKMAAEEEASREKARMEAKKAQEAWQAQKELKQLYQQDPTCSEVPTPRSHLSSQKSSMISHPQPAVRLPSSVTGQKDVCAAQNELVPLYDHLTKTEGKTQPEERGLLANTPTGPKAERWGEENEE